MAESVFMEAGSFPTIPGGTPGIRVATTIPDELRRHNISDEELEMLTIESKDGLSEMFWGFAGAAAAALPSAAEAIWNAYIEKNAVPLNLLHLAEIIIVFVCIVGAALVRIVSGGRSKRVEKLTATIRSRQTS